MVSESEVQSVLQATAGALVGIAWVLVFGTGDQNLAVDIGNVPLLALNALTSALAMILGKSMLLPMDDKGSDTSYQFTDTPIFGIWDALTLTALTGIVGCSSTLSTRRSYTNTYQFCCFFLAMMCIGSKACVFISWQNSRGTHSTYELIRPPLALSAEESNTISLTEELHPPGVPELPSGARNNTLGRYLLGFGIVSLWTAYGILNFTERLDRLTPAFLDQDYVPHLPLEIVLSMYQEPIHEVGKLIVNLKSMPALEDAHVTVYIKDSEANNTHIQQKTGADHVIALPNVGREGETFLNHILNNWDSLARQTIFLQAAC
ncbi:hypothetical protein G6011_09560 [Alternaria panax]|uniref:Uncharacterized protein n=1 Tax=Alternaria panax TaxID=48097 RepID=A0AAD4FB01_9PLEO|nr:hypothetical protein G6011_09560 [Alternaria panax]